MKMLLEVIHIFRVIEREVIAAAFSLSPSEVVEGDRRCSRRCFRYPRSYKWRYRLVSSTAINSEPIISNRPFRRDESTRLKFPSREPTRISVPWADAV